jgi:hypothetical protein
MFPHRFNASTVQPFNGLMKIVRLAADELFVDEGSNVLRFDQNDIVRILHFAFDEQKGFLRNYEPGTLE